MADGDDWTLSDLAYEPIEAEGRLKSIALRTGTAIETDVVSCALPVQPRSGKRLVFSTWIYVPQSFVGDRIGCNFRNRTKSNFRMHADLSKRDQWQRLWASSVVSGSEPDLTVGLEIAGAKDSIVFVAGGRFEEGYVPTDWPAPANHRPL